MRILTIILLVLCLMLLFTIGEELYFYYQYKKHTEYKFQNEKRVNDQITDSVTTPNGKK